MKKLVTLLLAFTMIIGVGAYAFADETVCELSEEDQVYMLSVKSQFLGDKVTDGTLTQEEANALYSDLENQLQKGSLKGLGFGVWLRGSEHAEKTSDIMPHKNASGDGVQPLDGTGNKGAQGSRNSENGAQKGRNNN